MERKQICLRIGVDLNSKLIQIAEEEMISKNKLIELELYKMVKSYERKGGLNVQKDLFHSIRERTNNR